MSKQPVLDFTGEATIVHRPDGTRVLKEAITWVETWDEVRGGPAVGSRTFTAPAGMVHDGMSVPFSQLSIAGYLTSIVLFFGFDATTAALVVAGLTGVITSALAHMNGATMQLPAALHDAAYRLRTWDDPDHPGNLNRRGEKMTRAEADKLMRSAALINGRRARRKVSAAKAWFLGGTHWAQRWVAWTVLAPMLGGYLASKKSFGQMVIDRSVLDDE